MAYLRLNRMLRRAAALLASLAVMSCPAATQTQPRVDSDQPSQTRPAVSQAEHEAEKKVSLSAGKIIEILRNEPGLLLAVKKMLVRKAYEQGRILDSADLSDEALFRLLRDDDNICVLATREIEDRYYVRAKPTQRELEQEQLQDTRRGIARTAMPKSSQGEASTNANKVSRSQEESYWEQHDSGWKNSRPSDLSDEPEESYPSNRHPAPDFAPDHPAREVQRASLEQEQEAAGNSSQETGRLPRVRPEDLPELLDVGSRAGSMARGLGSYGSNDGQAVHAEWSCRDPGRRWKLLR